MYPYIRGKSHGSNVFNLPKAPYLTDTFTYSYFERQVGCCPLPRSVFRISVSS